MRRGAIAALLFLGLLAAPWDVARRAEAPAGHLLTDRVAWRLEYEIRYRNSGPSPASVTLEIPLPRDREDYQEAEVLEIDPEPSRTASDRWGNRIAVVELREVPPGGTALARVVSRVTRRSLAVDIDASQPRPPDLAPHHLQAGEHAPVDDPVIAGTARTIVEGETNSWYRLVRLYDFVRTLDFQLTWPARSDREVLRSRVAQCADAAALLVSLARAVGIPARVVAGVYLRPEDPATRIAHAWVEAWLAPHGWVPLDPTMGRFDDSRFSRLGQLESCYVALWEERGSRGFAASGTQAGESLEVVVRHEVEAREFRSAPVVPVPDLSGTTDIAALFPPGPAGALMSEALRSGKPETRTHLARRGLETAPDSMALYKLLVGSTPAGPPRRALEQELRSRRPQSPAVRYARGLVALEESRWSEAEENLLAAGDTFPVRHALADLYLRTHQPGRASRALQQAASEFVTESLVDQAAELFQGLDDPAGVTALCTQALRLHPRAAELRLARARADFRLGRRVEAEEQVAALRQADPGNGLYTAVLGSLYLEAGDRERARSLFRESLQGRLDPRMEEYVRAVAANLEP